MSKHKEAGTADEGITAVPVHFKGQVNEMEAEKRNGFKFPKIGQRIIRSVCAVFICFIIYYLRGQEGSPFYSAIAVLQCMQPYKDSTAKMAKQRAIGTFIGAFWGLVVIMIELYLLKDGMEMTALTYLIISLATGCVLYSTVVLNYKDVSYFACVVFLSITVAHIADDNPYIFVMNRVLETLIGIGISIVVNSFHLPRKRNQDILFVSGVDEVLLTADEHLNSYSMVELNRLIERGANITVSTGRTPASLMEVISPIRLKLPVIVMDGAALFDIRKKSYLLTCVLSNQQSKEIMKVLEQSGVSYFANVVMDDVLVIYYEELRNSAEQDIYSKLSKSYYRNYVKRRPPENENVIYFMVIDLKEKITEVYSRLEREGFTKEYKILTYDSREYAGYSYIKIYNKEATRKNMLENLKEMLNLEKSVVFGTNPETCDVLIQNFDSNGLVKSIRKLYEPVKFFK